MRVRRLDRKRKGLWQPGVTAVICSEHFLPNDFHQQFGRKTLKPNASPSVFRFAPLKKPRKAPTKRSTGPSPSASKTTTTDTVDSNESVDIKEVLTNIYVDHAYAVTSPTKLKNQNDSLVQVLEEKNAEIRNLRRRELTKTGKIEQVIRELKEEKLLTAAAEHLLESYKDLPVHLFTRHAGGTGGEFSAEQKHFTLTIHYYSLCLRFEPF